MKKVILCLFILIAGFQVSSAQTSNDSQATPSKEEQEVIDLSRKKWIWMADKNVDCIWVVAGAR